VLLAAAAVWRAETESTPVLVIHRTLPAYVRLPGKAPVLGWPREGEAAVEVEGVGSFGTAGREAPVPIASVAKVMTAYLTLREHPLAPGEDGFTIRITRADVRDQKRRVALDESTLAIRRGETLTERQALEALMLPSANNIAALVAVHDAGSVSAFVDRMNAAAKDLGMSSTTYTDPSGFDKATVSTAADQLKLARVALRDPTFAAIVAEPSARLPVVGRAVNSNHLVGTDGFVGVKTGSDEVAGGCLVFARRVVVGGRSLTVVGAVLGQRRGELVDAALASARRLGDSVAAALGVMTALPAGAAVLSARNADGERVTAATAAPLREIGWAGMKLPVQVEMRPPARQLSVGQRLGTVTVRGASVERGAVVATKSLGGPSLGWRLQHLF
jgi:serine-type D-Ala-D-Ala carboxypeptidase (penicillin-binding protein 5/6)